MNIKEVIGMVVQQEFDAPDEFWKIRSNRREIVYPKKAMIYLIRTMTSETLKEIGRFGGYSDHSSIIHHVESCKSLMKQFDEFKIKVLICKKNAHNTIKQTLTNYEKETYNI